MENKQAAALDALEQLRKYARNSVADKIASSLAKQVKEAVTYDNNSAIAWKVIDDLTSLLEAGMEGDAFLRFIGSSATDLEVWAKKNEPDAAKKAFK